MAPINQAKAMFARHGCNFEQQLAWYLGHGTVISNAETFMMAKPINSERGDDEWNVGDADAWYVHCLVGRLKPEALCEMAGYSLPKLCFRRWKAKGNPLKCYDWAAFVRHAEPT